MNHPMDEDVKREQEPARYQLQWKHNGQWRYEEDGSGTFETREEAELASESGEYDSVRDTLRLVEIGPESFRVLRLPKGGR